MKMISRSLIASALTVSASMVLAQSVPPSQGGAGTIDPATVNVQQIDRFTLAQDTGETHRAKVMATDSSGKHIVGSILTYTGFGPQTIRSVITKLDRSNNIVWQRERTVSSDQTGYYERWGDGQPAKPALGGSGIASLEVAGIAVDAQDNVLVAFNTFFPDYNNGVQTLRRAAMTIIAKFDANGNFLWRNATPPDLTNSSNPAPFYAASEIRSFQVGANGSSLVLVDNYTLSGPQVYEKNDQTVAFKVDANGSSVLTVHYGLADDANTIKFNSVPIAFTESGTGELYLLSNEYPRVPTGDQYFNVIRKLSATGGALGEHDVPLYPGYTADNAAYTTEVWRAARADSSGNLYIAGYRFHKRPALNDTDQGEAKQLVLKFDPALSQTWRALGPQATGKYDNKGQPQVEVVDIALSSGGVTVGGWWDSRGTSAAENDFHWELTRYALSDGYRVWHRLYQSPNSNPNQGFNDILTAFRVDAQGNVYTYGLISVANGVASAVIKYADNGDLQFVKQLPSIYSSSPTMTLPSATNKPTFLGVVGHDAIIAEMDNPAVVAAAGSLANISTRVRVGGNDNVLIGGTIVTGPAGSTKKVLVRAIGPSLARAGLTGALTDTTLEVRDSAGHVYTNDNWKVADPGQPDQKAQIEATGIPPTDDRESAIIAVLPTGGSTAIVTGKGGASGIGLVELYDLESGAVTQLANISTRGVVETGNNVMIGGIIAIAPNPDRVFVRAIGPSLTAAGVANALQDPVLEVRDVNGNVIVSNDDWQTRDASGVSQKAEIEQTLIPPPDPRESAARVTLDPGNYTVIVRSKSGATGVALVEAYRLP